jgi:pimeloyl-ACP methyl ester carboxylesterase
MAALLIFADGASGFGHKWRKRSLDWRAAVMAGALCGVVICGAGLAQEGKDSSPPAEAQEEMLLTRDGVQLKVAYYPGSKGEETVPVVLLHMWQSTGASFKELAVYLQSQGHAVVVPDLRGHGGSTKIKGTGRSIEIAKLTPTQLKFVATTGDMDTIKGFLWKKNNSRELNLNRLCLVGAEFGASVAMDFALYDWSTEDYGPLQLGRFTKAIVLLSPELNFRGLNMQPALAHPGLRGPLVSYLIYVGAEDTKALAEARRIHNTLERFHLDQKDKKLEQRTLFFGRLPTKMQGTKLLEQKDLEIHKHIADFIRLRLVESDLAKEIKWKELKYPHQ